MRTIACLTLLAAATPAFAVDALVLHGTPGIPTFYGEVTGDLIASGAFGAVDIWDGSASTPTLGDLNAYDVVLLMPDFYWADFTAMGDVLADYVDGGGGVVESIFSWTQNRGGRYDTLGYQPMLSPTNEAYAGFDTLGTAAAHPIAANVGSFNESNYHSPDAFTMPGATEVLTYASGLPLASFWQPSGAGIVVGVNYYLPSAAVVGGGWDRATDGDIITVNSALFAAGGAPAGFRTSASGICGGAATIRTFDATPNGRLFYVSGSPGTSTIPAGPCAGRALPIANPRLRAQRTADAAGADTVNLAALNPAFCGATYVVVDAATCQVASSTLP